MVWQLDYSSVPPSPTAPVGPRRIQIHQPKGATQRSRITYEFFILTKAGKKVATKLSESTEELVEWVEEVPLRRGVVMTDGCSLISPGVRFLLVVWPLGS